jgi:uncharacterized protein
MSIRGLCWPRRRGSVSEPGTDHSQGSMGRQQGPAIAGRMTPLGDALPRAVERIVHALDPEKVVLFGSYAYGAPAADSDVDLLIVMQTSASPTDRHLAVCRLLRPRPFPVDIVVRTPAEVAQALERGDRFIAEILARGRVLYERRQ